MKKALGPAVLVLALVAAELILEGGQSPAGGSAELWRSEGPVEVLREDLRRHVGGASWSTDAGGHRRQLEARRAVESSMRVLVLGDDLTAGAGLEEQELYSARLEQYLREHSELKDAVVLQAVARGPVVERARWYASLAQEMQPDRVILQLSGRHSDEHAAFAFEGDPRATWTAPEEGPLALWRAWQRWRTGSDQARAESRVEDFVSRQGFSARVTRRAQDRFVRIQQDLRSGSRMDDADREYLRTLMRVEYGLDRELEKTQDARAWITLLDQLLSQGARVAVLFTGPGYLFRLDRSSVRDLALEEVYGPPLMREGELWVEGRPAALVHDRIARALFARLGAAGFFGPTAQPPETWVSEAHALQGLQDRVLGQDMETEREARESIPSTQEFLGDRVPWNVLRGLRPGGLVPPGEVVELFAFPGYLPETLEVEVDVPVEGPVPSLSVSFARIESREGGTSTAQDLGNGRQRITWQVPDPGVVYRDVRMPIELTFTSDEGPADVRLRRLEWIQGEN